MTAQEMLAVLKGAAVNRYSLFESLLSSIEQGNVLTDEETVFFETLKKEFVSPPSKVIEMSASLTGNAEISGG